MEVIDTIALSMGAAWASGINLYAAILVLGYLGSTGQMVLPAEMEIVSDPLVMTAAGFMYLVEFFIDKTPGADTAWDTLHSFIRIPAGAMLAAAAVGDVAPAVTLAAALLGGSLATATHFTKAGTRVVANTSPEPFSNWTLSVGEDVAVVAGIWTALNYPLTFLVVLVASVTLMIWLLPKLWRAVRAIFYRIGSWLGLRKATRDEPVNVDLRDLVPRGGLFGPHRD